MLQKDCLLCQKSFQTLFHTQKRCPTCLDKGLVFAKPPSKVTIARECVATFLCKNLLPRERFVEFSTNDYHAKPSLRAIFRGKDGGEVAWSGRLDVYISRMGTLNAEDRNAPPTWPEWVRFRQMRVTKAAPEITVCEDGHRKEGAMGETYEYISLDAVAETDLTPEEKEQELIYRTCRSKFTLRGLGGQYSAEFDSRNVIWGYEMYCYCRSHRINVKSIIAIVSPRNPLVLCTKEDGVKEKTYFPAHAGLIEVAEFVKEEK